VYELETDPEAVGDVQGLPASALAPYAEVLSMVEVAPWSGEAYNRQRPDGNMRVVPFGADGEGFVVYLILEDHRRVVVLRVMWFE
jgi:glycerate kinase